MKRLLQIGALVLGIAGLLCGGLYFFRGGANGKLVWDDPPVTYRKSLMTFAYKIYGDPSVENGRFFLSKIVFHNDGTGPVHDLSVSYQIPDYVPWTTPVIQSELPAGQTWVHCYYPQLPSKVTALTSQTNATLETKIRWANKAGEMKEENLPPQYIILRGVNELEYCDLPQNEVADWYDMFSVGEFSVAMVTPNDPVVQEFAAEITKRTGGTLAGITGGKELFQTMKAMYDYMCETGMRYTSTEGVPTQVGDVKTYVQTVKMPRNVIIHNEGLCIELALLWASVMEHLGCDTSLVFLKGHVFTIVSAGEQSVPIECTAITPKSVGSDATVIPFDKAVQMANQEYNDLVNNHKPFIVYNVKYCQQQGMHAPELPDYDVEKIKNILAQRSAHTAAAYAENAGSATRPAPANAQKNGGSATRPAPANAQVPPGYYRWVGVNNTVSIDVPESWARTENTSIPGVIFVAQDAQSSVGTTIFSFPRVSNPAQAMELAQQGVAHAIGGRLKTLTHEYKGNSIFYTGNTVYRDGSTAEWVGCFAPTPNGVVGLFVGAAKGRFERNQSIIRDIISSAKLGTYGGQAGENQSNEGNNNDENQ